MQLLSPSLESGNADSVNLGEELQLLGARIDRYLLDLVPDAPKSLYDPARHILHAGGKRVRPVLTALCAQLHSTKDSWLPAAAAVELLHTFTLVHDDIMDNAALRRNHPTTHTQFGTNAAILAGDVLIALALQALGTALAEHLADMLREFALAFRLVCEGQALDKDYELRNDLSVEQYLHMIDLKTSKVLELAAVLGCYSGDGAYVEELRAFAHHAGLAFQINDDLLDLTAAEAAFGKTVGGDILEGKRTYLFVSAMLHYKSVDASERLLLDRIRDRSATAADIPLARNLFSRLGVLEEASRAARAETEKAHRALESLPEGQAKRNLREYGSLLLERVR